jgi:hypothetical protein
VIFRPYWEVTPSIQRNEIVPHIQKDPGYIAKHNFQVITPKGEVVTENEVSPEVLEGLKSLHLLVRQKPGPTNSLGLVKIIFPNPENVYLHGTDVPELFSQDVRDFSHGCIRVEKPAELVAWVLRNNPGWDLERVKATMTGDKDDVQVNLVTRIPVLIVYGTAAVNEENQIRFFDDIYGYDAALEKACCRLSVCLVTSGSVFLRGRNLPTTHAAHVYMHKIGSGVIADSTAMQGQGRVAQRGRWNAGNANVDGHGLHVQAVQRYTMTMSAQVFVTPRRPVTANYVNFGIGAVQGHHFWIPEPDKRRSSGKVRL